MRWVAFDRHAYVTAAASRLTAIITVQAAPRTYLHSLALYRAEQDIILSSSAYEGQKTTRDALREGSERGHSRSSCVKYSGYPVTDRYFNRAGRAPHVATQPGIVQRAFGHPETSWSADAPQRDPMQAASQERPSTLRLRNQFMLS